MKMLEDVFFIAPFLVPSSHETFVKENRRFGGGEAIAESTRSTSKAGKTNAASTALSVAEFLDLRLTCSLARGLEITRLRRARRSELV